MWLLALLACGPGPDPELKPVRKALDAWREGVALLEAGDAIQAREAFQDARRHQPLDPLLLAWEARAAAASGELEEAVELLDRALLMDPGFATARYNRAAYLARLGKPAAAAPELEKALLSGVVTAREAAADPDFEPYLGHPEFLFLPSEVLSVLSADGPTGPVFAGSEFTLTVKLLGAGDGPVGVSATVLEGPMRLTTVRETALDSTDGPVREIEWTWTALGPGTVAIGPLQASVGERRVGIEPIEVTVLAAPGATAPEVRHDGRLPTALEFGFGELPRTLRAGDDLVVVTALGDRVEVSPEPDNRPQQLVYSDRGTPRFRAYRWPGEAVVKRDVRVIRQGKTVIEQGVGGGP